MSRLPLAQNSPLSTSATKATTSAVDVSVVIVSYNVREFVTQALQSVARALEGLDVEVFLVDNDSADGTATHIQAQFPDVQVIANKENVGFATANNQAIRQARGRHVLLLNPDTLVQEDTLRKMVAFMDAHPDAGAVGCRILNPDGSFALESRRAFPTPKVALYRLLGLSRLFPASPRFGRYNMTFLSKDNVCEVDALSGCCMMIRREAIWGSDEPNQSDRTAAGLLDERYFMYGEDLDWCFRIQQAGWRNYYTPDTQIVHYKGMSTRKGELRYVLLFYGAMLRFVEKHLAPEADAAGGIRRLSSLAMRVVLRTGIFLRGALAATVRLVKTALPFVGDAAISLATLLAFTLVWSQLRGVAYDTFFLALVLPAYAVIHATGIRLMGNRTRKVLNGTGRGTLLAMLLCATLSFLIPSIAFSRAILIAGLGLAGLAIALVRTRHKARLRNPRRALFVGKHGSARRLADLFANRFVPPIQLLGYVGKNADSSVALPWLGGRRQLHDIAWLQEADEVIFSADDLTNTTILGGMRELEGLPLSCKILTSNNDRLIGTASVEDLAAPLLEAERMVAPVRSMLSRRLLDGCVSLAGLAVLPFIKGLHRIRPRLRTARWITLGNRLPDVLAGTISLVGFSLDGPHPPTDWGLPPGLVSILDTLPTPTPSNLSIVEAHRLYWSYTRHQSAWMDLQILFRALNR